MLTSQSFDASRTLIIDGGLSTQVESHGVNVNDPLWTARVLLERPDIIAAAHRDFVEAGADVLITSSYQISSQGFEAAGLTRFDAHRALAESVAVARSAANPNTIIAASVGPYGAISHDGAEYRGRYGITPHELTSFHKERIDVLIDAGPDLLALETIPDADELDALADALDGSIPCWVSVTASDADTLWSGHSLADALTRAERIPGIVGVGINCTDPTVVTSILQSWAQQTALPLITYPNAGGVWDPHTATWDQPPQNLQDYAREWSAAGARAVGGCCGTNAQMISQIALALSD